MREPGSITELRLDQCRRWQQGEPVRVEDYLKQQANLRSDADGLLDLIYNEIFLREQQGDEPQLEEYLRRFPEFESQLRVQFEVHQMIQEGVRELASSKVTFGHQHERETPSSQPAQVAVPGYEILGQLGRGGMGVVYLARQVDLKRRVALKMILSGPHASAAERTRFRIEAEAVARLQHPNIVQIFEVNEQDGIPYLALELVDGTNLADQLEQAPWPTLAATRLVETLARAIHHAHQQGIIHRDLKPGNVLLTSTGIPKITDFGLAKLLDADTAPTTTTGFLGTPHYMAPEQTAKSSRFIGPATDIHALGAVLYELLTGRPPFDGATALDVLEQVRFYDPLPPSHWQGHVPRDLETICLKCLAKEPRQRYASALDLAEDLRRFQDGEPIWARPVSVWERLRKWAWRRRTGLTLIALAGLVLVLLGLWHHLNVQKREQQARSDEAARRDHANQVYRQFVHLRDEALFHGIYGTLFTDRDAPGNLQAMATTAQEALSLVQVTLAAETPPVFDPYTTEAERETLTLGSYQLLLLLAEAIAEPADAQTVADLHHRARQALAILERAATLTSPTQAYHLRRARYLTQLGDAQGAERERARASQLPTTRLIDFLLLGQEHYRLGEIARARQDLEHALLLQPNDFWSQHFLAVCLVKLGQPGQAEEYLNRCLKQKPRFIWTYLLRSIAYEKLEDIAAAEADYEHALQLQPNADARYLLFGNRGRMRLERQRLTAAVADLQAAIACQPAYYHAYLYLSMAYFRLGNEPEAAHCLEQALARHAPARELAGYHVERARDLIRQQRFAESLQASDAALGSLPSSVAALEVRVDALIQLHYYPEAVQTLDRLLQLGKPMPVEIYRKRGFVRMQLRKYLDAADDYSHVLHLQPDVETWAHRGWAYLLADAWKPALRDFEEAIQLAGLPEVSASTLGLMGAPVGTGSFLALATLFPGRSLQVAYIPDACVGRGLARVMLGHYRSAVHDADEALRRRPTAPEMMHNIACIYAQAADRAETADERDRLTLAADYRRRALMALRGTLELLKPSQRLPFWRDQVLTDPALASLRRDAVFQQLDEEVSRSEPE